MGQPADAVRLDRGARPLPEPFPRRQLVGRSRIHERIARRDGVWHDTVILERRAS